MPLKKGDIVTLNSTIMQGDNVLKAGIEGEVHSAGGGRVTVDFQVSADLIVRDTVLEMVLDHDDDKRTALREVKGSRLDGLIDQTRADLNKLPSATAGERNDILKRTLETLLIILKAQKHQGKQ